MWVVTGGCVKESWDRTTPFDRSGWNCVAKAAWLFRAKCSSDHRRRAADLQYGLPHHSTAELQKKGIKTFIETSGAYPLFMLVPGTGSACLQRSLKAHSRARHYPLCIMSSKWSFSIRVILNGLRNMQRRFQTAVNYTCSRNGQNRKRSPPIIDYVMANPKWEISGRPTNF